MELTVGGKKITVYRHGVEGEPLIYLHTVRGEGEAVWQACCQEGCSPFTLAVISRLDWDRDMSPWAIPAIGPGDTPCSGGADAYLTLLTGAILPAVEERLGRRPRFRAIAGYSLAGLFALYALYRTSAFTRAASASGSLWFPGFCDFVSSQPLQAQATHIYLSLGSLESRTDNKFLAPVQVNTEKIAAHYQGLGLKTIFTLNPGNHFHRPEVRMAKGLVWLLQGGEAQEG